jgi:hypothetical protein
MKSLFLRALLAAALLAAPAFGQVLPHTTVSPAGDIVRIEMASLTAAASSPWFDVSSYGSTYHALTFTYPTQPGAVTVALECSNDGGATVTSTIGTSTSTTGATIAGSGVCNRIRLTTSLLTGAINIRGVYRGYASTVSAGDIAHDIADSGNPVKIGCRAIGFGADPTAVAANDRSNLYCTRDGVAFVIGGHPNTQTISAQVQDADGAQSDTALVTVSAGTKIIVTRVTATCDGGTTGPTNIKVGFGATTLPASAHTGVAGIIHDFDGVPAGQGFTVGDGQGILGIGADGEDLRYTMEDPAGGNCTVTASYFTEG